MSEHHHDSCGLHCLQIHNLTVAADGRRLLDGVNLHAHCGELTAIIGRNGAGKSTLMRSLVGEMPYTGEVTFSGHGGKPTPRKPRCGYVPQMLAIDKSSPTTVQDMLLCYTTRWPVFLPHRRKTGENLKQHLDAFGAGELLSCRVGDLSGGELQRVLLALAMMRQPDLVLLDEPVSGIDQDGQQSFYRMLDRLRERDILVMLVTHDLSFVRRHADRVVLLENGKVAATGTPSSVFATDAFENAFPLEAAKEADV
ncbi:MAG: metal ABC transporter ATP-binding protein [Clostridia bacterium]|nr:metal ABC transporter ATP-binding protein [Clostridia bacterium]